MDIVYIRGLEIETVIGIYDWEKKIKQKVTIDLDMAWDFSSAAEKDDIDGALDYKAVSKRLIDFVESSKIELMETLGTRIVDIVMNEFDVPWLRLRLGKPGAVTHADDVGVIMERGSKE